MADQELGGVAVVGTFTISIPVDMPKQIKEAVMSDGSSRYAFFKKYRKWKLNWTKATKAELDVLIDRYALNQITTWKNTDESATVYDVVITDFSYDSVDPISATKTYKASMNLKEAI